MSTFYVARGKLAFRARLTRLDAIRLAWCGWCVVRVRVPLVVAS